MKHKKLIGFTVCLLLCGYWLVMHAFNMIHVRYYGLFRYGMVDEWYVYKAPETIPIESHIFSYEFIPPYLYVYGVTGYSKVNVAPFGKIEKIPNRRFYEGMSEGIFGPILSPLPRLEEKLGWQLQLAGSLEEVSAYDRGVYRRLWENGKKWKEHYFYTSEKYEPETYEERLQKSREIEAGLDALWGNALPSER